MCKMVCMGVFIGVRKCIVYLLLTIRFYSYLWYMHTVHCTLYDIYILWTMYTAYNSYTYELDINGFSNIIA